jgi:hypothetical protein
LVVTKEQQQRQGERKAMTKGKATAEEREMLSEQEAAAWLGLAVKTLQNWRWQGRGPGFIKLGPRRAPIRYRLSDLREYVDQCAVRPGGQ